MNVESFDISKARYLEGGDAVIEAMIAPVQHPDNQEYFKREAASVMNNVNTYGEQFVTNVTNMYNAYNHSGFYQEVQQLARQTQTIITPTSIYPIYNNEQLPLVEGHMRRYIMAQPDLRQLHNTQSCNSYDGEYVDLFPNTTKFDHYDYRRVMTGMLYKDKDTWNISTVTESLDGDRELEFWEKSAILETWKTVKRCIADDLDPSDLLLSEL